MAARAGRPPRAWRPKTTSSAPAEKAENAEPAENSEPSEPAEATEKAEPADPIEPIESTEPTEPIDSSEPSLAIDRNESREESEIATGRAEASRTSRVSRTTVPPTGPSRAPAGIPLIPGIAGVRS